MNQQSWSDLYDYYVYVYVITYDYSSYKDVYVSYSNNQTHIAQKFGCGIIMHAYEFVW